MARLTYVIPTMVAFFLCNAMAMDPRKMNDKQFPCMAKSYLLSPIEVSMAR